MAAARVLAAAAAAGCWAANAAAAVAVDCWVAEVEADAEIAAEFATNANRSAAAADCSRAAENVAARELLDVPSCQHPVPRHLVIAHLHRHPVDVVHLLAVADVAAVAESCPRYFLVSVTAATAVAIAASRPIIVAVPRDRNANDGSPVAVVVVSQPQVAAAKHVLNASDEFAAVAVASRQTPAAAGHRRHPFAAAAANLTASL